MGVTTFTHDELCAFGVRWLKNTGKCSWVVREPVWHGPFRAEQPDVFGVRFHGGVQTVLIECKATRADFLSDAQKPFRYYSHNGLGMYRYYLTPKNLIWPAQLPENWGLLEVTNKTCRKVVEAKKQPCDQNKESYFAWSLLAKLERRAPRLDEFNKLPPWIEEP
jgi:hypothetical protein